MPDFLLPYVSLLQALAALGVLLLIQTIVLDIAGMRARHVPGMPVTTGHGDFLFRATRAHGNTNENLGAFIVAVLAALLLGANAGWTNGLAWAFVGARAAHMVCYYGDWRLPRSAAFAVGLVAQAGLVVVSVMAAAVG